MARLIGRSRRGSATWLLLLLAVLVALAATYALFLASALGGAL